jgi:hypothetical protein
MLNKFGMLVVVVVAFVLGCGGVKSPTPPETDVGVAVVDTSDAGDVQPEAVPVEPEDAAPEAAADDGDQEVLAAPVTINGPVKVTEPLTVERKQELCLAAIYALTPDWRLSTCDAMQADEENGDQRQARCRAQRAPLVKFADDICKAVIEETARFGIDDFLMPIAVMERESSIGRVNFDRESHVYRVQTDICKLFLSTSRIVRRESGRRAGTEKITWTYSDGANQQHQNTQMVIVESEDAGGLNINTCVAGETGLFQLLPTNYGNGRCVGFRQAGGRCDGQVLRGSREERREEVLADPILQVRLGVQELARHRDICPEADRGDWTKVVGTYNVGNCDYGEKWQEYTRKIIRHYLDACRGGFVSDPTGVPRMLADVWPDCARVQAVYDEQRDVEAASGRE